MRPAVIGRVPAWYLEDMLSLRVRGWCAYSLASALCATVVGCGGLELADGGDEANNDSDGLGDGGGADTGGTSPGDGGGDGDTGGGSGATEPDCGPYVCEGVGTCIEEGGEPYCECDEGYILQGLTCEPCSAVDISDFEVAIDMIDFKGQVLIDGALAQTSLSDRGQVVAVNTRTGDRVVLTDTRNGAFDVGVVPGVYDLYYELIAGGAQVPRNEHAFLETVTLTEDETRYRVELFPVRIEGDILINKSTPTTSFSNRGDVVLEDPDSGDRARIGSTGDGQYDALVLAGRYDIYYELTAGGSTVPRNTHGLITTDANVDAGFADPIDITMLDVDGAITINTAIPSTSNFDDGQLWLRSADGLDEFMVGNTRNGSYAAKVMPGTYDVIYSLESGGITVPKNRAAKLQTVDLSAAGAVDIDIPMVTASGNITLNGVAPSTSFFDDGRVWLASADGRDQAQLGLTSDGSYSAPVVPGTYELRYGVESAGPTVPRNTNAFLSTVDISSQPQNDVDIQAVAIDGGITVGGAVPPSSIYQTAKIVLRSPDRKDSLELAKTHEGSYQSRVIPGTYDVTYVEDGATALPGNLNGDVLDDLELSSDMSVSIDVPVVTVQGSVTLDGAPPPTNTSNVGRIVLERRAENDAVLVTKTTNASFASDVVPGTYDVYYQVEQTAGEVPNNERARLACVQIEL